MAESLPVDFEEIDALVAETHDAPHAREVLTSAIERALRRKLCAAHGEVLITARLDEHFVTHFDLRVQGFAHVAMHNEGIARDVRVFLEEARTRYAGVLSAATPAAQLDAARSLSDEELAALARARRHAR